MERARKKERGDTKGGHEREEEDIFAREGEKEGHEREEGEARERGSQREESELERQRKSV